MSKAAEDKIRREELAFKAYATDRLAEAYPEKERVIQLAAIYPENGRRRLSAWIDGELAFGAGSSNAEAVDRLVQRFKPRTPEQKAECERCHIASFTPTFSDHA